VRRVCESYQEWRLLDSAGGFTAMSDAILQMYEAMQQVSRETCYREQVALLRVLQQCSQRSRADRARAASSRADRSLPVSTLWLLLHCVISGP